MGLKANIGGTLKNISSLYTNIGGSLKKIKAMYTNNNGTLKRIFNSAAGYAWKRYALNFSSTGKMASMSSGSKLFAGDQFEKTATGYTLLNGQSTAAGSLVAGNVLVSTTTGSTAQNGSNLYVVERYSSSRLYYSTLNKSEPYGAFVDEVESETKDFPTLGGTGEYFYVMKNAPFNKYSAAYAKQTSEYDQFSGYGNLYLVSSYSVNSETGEFDAVVDSYEMTIDTLSSGDMFVEGYSEHPTAIYTMIESMYDDTISGYVYYVDRDYIETTKGDLIGQVTADADAYPIDGVQDGYWYTLQR